MEYKPMKLQSPLYGLAIRHPVGQESTAVLENLTDDYKIDYLRPVLDEMKQTGVRNVVLDLSQFPATSRRQWLAFLDGAIAMASDFETRYTGITADEAGAGEPSFRDYIAPKIAESLDVAVQSFSE